MEHCKTMVCMNYECTYTFHCTVISSIKHPGVYLYLQRLFTQCQNEAGVYSQPVSEWLAVASFVVLSADSMTVNLKEHLFHC